MIESPTTEKIMRGEPVRISVSSMDAAQIDRLKGWLTQFKHGKCAQQMHCINCVETTSTDNRIHLKVSIGSNVPVDQRSLLASFMQDCCSDSPSLTIDSIE